MLRCIIIEDQAPAQRILKTYLENTPELSLVGVFSDPSKAIESVPKLNVDVAFLDIHLPGVSGIDVAEKLPNHIQVIFTTAFRDFAIKSYELNAVDYLLKPFSLERFTMAVEKLNFDKRVKGATIFVKKHNAHIQIATKDILYIKADSDYTEVYTLDERFVVSKSLRNWELELNEYGFHKIHRSYLVNIKHVDSIHGNEVKLSSDQKLPIGRTYKSSFLSLVLGK